MKAPAGPPDRRDQDGRGSAYAAIGNGKSKQGCTVEELHQLVVSIQMELQGQMNELHKTVAKRKAHRSEGRMWRFLPNFYRSINEDSDGFDPSGSVIEKSVTVCVITTVVIAVVTLAAYYWSHQFTETKEVSNPTVEQYEDLLDKENLIGLPICPCTAPLVPHGGDYGGFVTQVNYKLDPICTRGMSEPELGSNSEFTEIDIPSSMPGTPDTRAYACAQLQTENGGGVWRTAAGVLRDHNAADCAKLGAVVTNMLYELNELCEIANHTNEVSLDDWKLTLMPSEFLHMRSTLVQQVTKSLTHLAVKNGLTLQPTAKVSNVGELLEDNTRPSLPADASRFSIDPSFATSCTGDFHLGSYEAPYSNWRALLHQCRPNGGGTWTAQCCTRVPGTEEPVCDPIITYPCTASMLELSRRRHMSAYPGLLAASSAAFLEGADDSARRQNVAERSESKSTGFEVEDSEKDRMYSKYFEICAPSVCEYLERSHHIYALILVLSSLIGGIATVLRNSGFLFTACARKLVARKGQPEHLELHQPPWSTEVNPVEGVAPPTEQPDSQKLEGSKQASGKEMTPSLPGQAEDEASPLADGQVQCVSCGP